MANSRVQLNPRGMDDLLKSDGVAKELNRRMQRVLAAAEASAPVHTGNYKAGLRLVDEVHRTRVVSRVVGTAPHSHLVESRTGNLARALDAAGGD